MSEQTWTPPGEAQIAEVDAFLTAYDFMIVDPRFVNAVDLITAYRRALPILRRLAETGATLYEDQDGKRCALCTQKAGQCLDSCPATLAAPWKEA